MKVGMTVIIVCIIVVAVCIVNVVVGGIPSSPPAWYIRKWDYTFSFRRAPKMCVASKFSRARVDTRRVGVRDFGKPRHVSAYLDPPPRTVEVIVGVSYNGFHD